MNYIYSAFVITALLGFVLFVWGIVFTKRTGKLEFVAIALVGVALVFASVKASHNFEKLNFSHSVNEKP